MKDICHCGKNKDSRSVQCRICKDKEPDIKICMGCLVPYPIESYALRPNGRGGFKRRSRCKGCDAAYMRKSRKANPKKYKEIKKKHYKNNPQAVKIMQLRRMFRKIGFDPFLGVKLFTEHSGLCDICGKTNNNGQALAIDHCHSTGSFRGFLCSLCNTGLGYFKDNTITMESAIKYLRLHSLTKTS